MAIAAGTCTCVPARREHMSPSSGVSTEKDKEPRERKPPKPLDPTVAALRKVQKVTELFRELEAPERSYLMGKLAMLDRELAHEPAGEVAAGSIGHPADIRGVTVEDGRVGA